MNYNLTADMDSIFSKTGVLSKNLPGFEYRDSQKEMAILVADAIEEKHHLIVEAGTGTGKTLAYLVPSIFSGSKVIVSTGTKNLQEQIFDKDLPLLNHLFPQKHFTFHLMKGRSNYLCVRRLNLYIQQQQQMTLLPETENPHLDKIREWAHTTDTGDRSELSFLHDHSPVWDQINSRSEFCLTTRCAERKCFLNILKQKAHDADILLVNHHLYLSDLMLKAARKGAILPECPVVIFDEGHLLENIATEFFGAQLSNIQFDILEREMLTYCEQQKLHIPEITDAFRKVIVKINELFNELQQNVENDRARLHPKHISSQMHTTVFYLNNELTLLESYLYELTLESEDAKIIKDRLTELKQNLKFILAMDDPGYVYWCEFRGNFKILKASPIEINQDFKQLILDQQDTVVLTSATLSTMNNFSFIKNRLGIIDCEESILNSPFQLGNQVALYIEKNLCDPRHENYVESASEIAKRILEITRGRALFLFTSFKVMHAMYELLSPDLQQTILLQGEESKSALLNRFREDIHSILFATSSFWQGIDVPGEALSCVIIDKIPFAVPSEPVVEARIEKIRERDGNPFLEYQVPAAILTLKQGFGRLIRTGNDRGILVLLDSRLLSKQYGQQFLKSFERYPLATNITDLLKILPKGLIN